MGMYYLLMDYIVPVYINIGGGNTFAPTPLPPSVEEKRKFYREHLPICRPKTKRLLDVENGLRLYVAYYDFDVGHFVIGSRSRRRAYDLATVIRGILSLFYGWQPDDRTGSYYLQELKRLPQPHWKKERMVTELGEINCAMSYNPIILSQLQSGCYVSHDAYVNLPSLIIRLWGKPDIVEALDHAMESRFLVCGFMVQSYYESHYSKDRPLVPRWEMEKRYFENRYRYETAFVAAFKGIERFLGVNQIKERRIDAILQKKSDLGITPDTKYTRYHEIFSGYEQYVTYKEMICHFLHLRNTVAAHGNRKPPKHAKLIQDHVFEIQLFLIELISKAIFLEG